MRTVARFSLAVAADQGSAPPQRLSDTAWQWGRPILPPMPIRMYKNFTDTDLDAIFAYLQSIPAVKNHVPEPLPPVAAAN